MGNWKLGNLTYYARHGNFILNMTRYINTTSFDISLDEIPTISAYFAAVVSIIGLLGRVAYGRDEKKASASIDR